MKDCLKTEFASKPDSQTKVIDSVKSYVKDFLETAMQVVTDSSRGGVSQNIQTKVKELSSENIGIKRVNTEFFKSLVKDIACDRYATALELYTQSESEIIFKSL